MDMDKSNVDSLAKMNNPPKPANIMVFGQDVSLDVDIFGLRWKLGEVKMFVKEAWVEGQGLVPYDKDGDPVIFSINRVLDTLPQIPHTYSPSPEGVNPMKDHFDDILTPEEQNELHIPPNDSRAESAELFASAPVDIEIDSNESPDSAEEDLPITNNCLEVTIIQDSGTVPDVKNLNNPAGIGKTSSTSQIDKSVHSQGMKEKDAELIPETILDGDLQQPELTVLEKENVLLANPICLPQEVVQNDSGLPSRNISPHAQGSPVRFVCEHCTVGFYHKYQWKNHLKIHTGRLVHKCQCGKCGGIPYRDYRAMRKHHNQAYC